MFPNALGQPVEIRLHALWMGFGLVTFPMLDSNNLIRRINHADAANGTTRINT